MLTKRLVIAALFIGGLALAVGCKKEEEKPAVDTGGGGNTLGDTLGKAADDAKQTGEKLAGDAKAAAEQAAKGVEKKLDEVGKAIEEGKTEAAESTLKTVEDIKSTLSQEWQDKIAAARKKLDEAKAAAPKTE